MSDEVDVTGAAEIDDLPPSPETELVGDEPKGKEITQEPDDLRDAMRTLAETVNRSMTPKPAEPARLSPEEEAKLWGVWDPEASDKEFFKKFFRFNPDATPEEVQSAKELFAMMQRGLMTQAITGSQNIVEMAMHRLNQEYAPLREYVEEMRREGIRNRFYDQYETLADDRYAEIIAAVANTLANKTFDNEDAYFKALAEGAAENIKKLIPDFALGEKKKPTRTTGKAPKLPRTTAGGGGGAGKTRVDSLQPTGMRNDIDSLEFDEGQS